MKKICLFVMMMQLASSAFALTPEFSAYMRAGTGKNGLGGAQECLVNKGSSGNEFRLGNECGIYSELSFGAFLLKPETETAPFFAFHSTFAFAYGNREDVEAPTLAWVPREFYVEGGRVDHRDFYLWMGKRFYRWGSIDMNDFFSIDMSGPGVGVVGSKSDSGTWSAAVINNTPSREFNGAGDNNPVVTGIGNATKTSLHLRLDDMATAFGSWSYWLAGGSTSATDGAGVSYKSATGAMLGLRNSHNLWGGKNEIGVAGGQGVMSNLSSRGELVRDCTTLNNALCNVTDSSRVRVWDGLSFEGERWTGQVAVIYEDFNMGRGSHSKWASVGIRPIYWFTEHLSLATEAGTSTVADDSDGLGSRGLTRLTIAPQMSFGKGNSSRPVFRAFYSRTSWTDNNKVSAAVPAPGFSPYATRTEKDSVGVQTEAWF